MDNPLLEIQELPPFSAIEPEHVGPAVDALLAENRASLKKLLGGERKQTFETLVEPIERMSHRLSRIWSPVSHMNSVVNTEALRAAYNSSLPKLSAYATELGQNEDLYRAYSRVAEGKDEALTDAQRKLLEDALRDFRLAGVSLDGARKTRFKEVMQELSRLQARFEENVMDATNAWFHHVTDEAELAGLPAHAISRAREEARRREMSGWVLTLDYPSYHAVMTYAEREPLRRRYYEAWVTRASDQAAGSEEWDNTEVMNNILGLRHEVASLTGFRSFAEYSLASKMAGDVAEVLGFLEQLASRSRDAARGEMRELEDLAGRPLNTWDVAYYAEKLRQQRFEISDEMLRPYFPVERVLSGLFDLVERLYGVRVERREGVDAWHEQTAYYNVVEPDGHVRGGFYLDLYARPKKRGGAWMDECVIRARVNGTSARPVAYLVCNFTPPVDGEPALLTHDEVVTLFHEFGHTLHHLLTRVDYPSLAGINGVPWDAVELPSQFMENFAWRAEVLPLISGHHETGAPLPAELFERLLATRRFNAAMQMLRQLEFALFDMRIHSEFDPERPGLVREVLSEVRDSVAVIETPDFNRFEHSFSHIFGGGYAAGYYSYKWAEVLSADAFAAFDEAGVLDEDTGKRFMRSILEVGGTRGAMDAYVAFRGRRPTLDALLLQCGLNG